MIATRLGVLFAAAWLALTAFVAMAADLPTSASSVAATAIVGLLAPLLWPGIAAGATASVRRILVWSIGAALAAAIVMRALGRPAPPLARTWPTCATLLAILLVAHTLAATIEARWRNAGGDAASGREFAARLVTLLLAALGALPLWLGPAAELLNPRHPWIIDIVIGASPLTHLAVAAGNDLLRNGWLYQNANLAALPFTYPEAGAVGLAYAALVATCALGALALVRRRTPNAAHPENPKEVQS